jgi:hypothetical protein
MSAVEFSKPANVEGRTACRFVRLRSDATAPKLKAKALKSATHQVCKPAVHGSDGLKQEQVQ